MYRASVSRRSGSSIDAPVRRVVYVCTLPHSMSLYEPHVTGWQCCCLLAGLLSLGRHLVAPQGPAEATSPPMYCVRTWLLIGGLSVFLGLFRIVRVKTKLDLGQADAKPTNRQLITIQA